MRLIIESRESLFYLDNPKFPVEEANDHRKMKPLFVNSPHHFPCLLKGGRKMIKNPPFLVRLSGRFGVDVVL